MPEPPAEAPLDIYLVAIGGTGMAPIACLLQEAGHRVRGADGPLYPPMSTLLEQAGITPEVGYDPSHLDPRPDLVVIGNAVPRTNPEAERVESLGIERVSMPEALSRFFLRGREPLVVAGTHGKTTTTSMAAWVWTATGRDPGYLIGGVPLDLGRSFERGGGPRFIIEGDEYNAAYFDRGAKFLHYAPQALILTGVEYDHADLYPTPESLLEAYRRLVRLPPSDGVIAACGDSHQVLELVADARCEVVTYGLSDHNEIAPVDPPTHGAEGSRFSLLDDEAGRVDITLPLGGDHNVTNALGVWAIGRRDGIPAAEIAAALGRFSGVRRRMEELGTAAGVTVVDDFAHHPTALGETARALRSRYPDRRLVVLFEPRSLTAGRAFLFESYREAAQACDVLVIAPVFHRDRLEPAERLDRHLLVESLRADGIEAHAPSDLDDAHDLALRVLRPGDLVVTMSSGDFGDMPRRLLASLVELAAV